jgi:hypothetical protein
LEAAGFYLTEHSPIFVQDAGASRREALAAGSVMLAGLFSAAPAQAFLGFGEGEARNAAYKEETVSGSSSKAPALIKSAYGTAQGSCV